MLGNLHVRFGVGVEVQLPGLHYKEHPVLTRKDWMGNHEWCFYGWKLGAAHQFYGPNNASDTWELSKATNGECAIGSGVRLNFPDGSRLDVTPPSDKHKVREVTVSDESVILHGMSPVSDVWRVKKINPQSMVHLTEKVCLMYCA